MTLDEAIKHCEVVARENERFCYTKGGKGGYFNEDTDWNNRKCAKEHRQLAAWLTELKQLRKQMIHSEKPNKWINKPQESEDEKVIRIKKGTLKVRTGRYVIYDVEWLKTHFNTTEAKIYGQPSEDWNAVLDELNRIGRNAFKDDTDYDNLFDFISNLPNVKPQSEKHTEERTEMHECDYISRKFMMDMGATCIAARNKDGDLVALGALDILPSVNLQPKAEHKQKTGHWVSHSEYCKMNNLIPSGLGCYFWCSECNCGIDYKYFHLVDYNYCPNCGAKMGR